MVRVEAVSCAAAARGEGTLKPGSSNILWMATCSNSDGSVTEIPVKDTIKSISHTRERERESASERDLERERQRARERKSRRERETARERERERERKNNTYHMHTWIQQYTVSVHSRQLSQT